MPPTRARPTKVSRDVDAGCYVCSGLKPRWIGSQAQGTAARHHDATGHRTWARVEMNVVYGTDEEKGQGKLFSD